MKKAVHIYLASFEWYIILLSAVAILCISDNRDYSIVYGIRISESLGDIDLRAFSRWAIMMSFPIVLNGNYLCRLNDMETYIMLRLKKWSNFYLLQIYGCLFTAMLWSAVICLLGVVLISHNNTLAVCIMIFANQILWCLINSCIYSLKKYASLSGVITAAFFSLSFFLGEYFPTYAMFLPTSWGMVLRSNLFQDSGTSPAYMVMGSALCCALIIVATYTLLKVKRSEV